mgnify:CR=1 FL=1
MPGAASLSAGLPPGAAAAAAAVATAAPAPAVPPSPGLAVVRCSSKPELLSPPRLGLCQESLCRPGAASVSGGLPPGAAAAAAAAGAAARDDGINVSPR